MIEFKIICARYRSGYHKTRLISADALNRATSEAVNAKDFFECASDIVEVSERGAIQMDGDTHWLGDSYLED